MIEGLAQWGENEGGGSGGGGWMGSYGGVGQPCRLIDGDR